MHGKKMKSWHAPALAASTKLCRLSNWKGSVLPLHASRGLKERRVSSELHINITNINYFETVFYFDLTENTKKGSHRKLGMKMSKT